eukprot:Rmarinus@m.28090
MSGPKASHGSQVRGRRTTYPTGASSAMSRRSKGTPKAQMHPTPPSNVHLLPHSGRPCVCEACSCGLHHCKHRDMNDGRCISSPAPMESTYRSSFPLCRPSSPVFLTKNPPKYAPPIPIDDRTTYAQEFVPQKIFPQRPRTTQAPGRMRPFVASTSYQTDFCAKRIPFRGELDEKRRSHPGPSAAKIGKSMYQTTFTKFKYGVPDTAAGKAAEWGMGGGFYGDSRYRADFVGFRPERTKAAHGEQSASNAWATVGDMDLNTVYQDEFTSKEPRVCRVIEMKRGDPRAFTPHCNYQVHTARSGPCT